VDHAVNSCGSSAVKIGDAKSSLSSSNIYTTSFSLAASNGKVIDLCGDVKAGAESGDWIAKVDADGVGLATSKSVSATAADIQTITIGAGTLTATNGAKPTAAILVGGSTGNYMAQYTFSASNEGFTIDKLKLKVPNNFATSTTGITIKYKDKAGANQQSTQVLGFAATDSSATATYTGLTFYVPSNGSANLDVYVDLTTVGTGSGASGASGAITFDWDEGFKATGDSGTSVTTVGSADLTNNTFYVRKSKPTFAVLSAGTAPTSRLFKFSVAADNAGNIDLKQLTFNIVTSGCDVISLKLYDVDGNALTTTAVTPTWDGSSSGDASLLIGAVDDTVETISTTAKIYELKGTVTGFSTTSGDSITVSFKQDTAAVNTLGAYTNGADGAYTANAGNIWSDRSASAHTTVTTDWTNGYLLKDMSTSQSF